MAQLRFTIGVPGAGAAARTAESDSMVPRMSRIEGGSAARLAEERRRTEEAPARRVMPSIRLSAGPRPGSPNEAQVTRVAQDGVPIHPPSFPEVASLSGVPDATSPGAGANAPHPYATSPSQQQQTAAHRVKSLVQALFGSSEN